MIRFLASRAPAVAVPADQIQARYTSYRWQALFGVFIGYMAYYLVRNNFTLSSPYLTKALNLSKAEFGVLSSALLITYGVSKGIMSSIADKCNPKLYMVFGLVLSAIINFLLGFSTAYWMFFVLVVLN